MYAFWLFDGAKVGLLFHSTKQNGKKITLHPPKHLYLPQKALGIYFGAKKKRCLHQKAMQAAVGGRTSIIARR